MLLEDVFQQNKEVNKERRNGIQETGEEIQTRGKGSTQDDREGMYYGNACI